MALIQISNLNPTDGDLFAGTESFLTELQETDSRQVFGGTGYGYGYGYGGKNKGEKEGKEGKGKGYGYGGGKGYGHGGGCGYCCDED